MEDERCAGAAVVLVSLGGGVEEGRGEGGEGKGAVEGDYLVVGLGWGGWYILFVMRNRGSDFWNEETIFV